MLVPLLTEATLLDDSGTLVVVWHLDLRSPSDRTPITTLFKAGRQEHSVAELGTIRISKPVRFRDFGEGLIMDPSETLVSRTVVTSEQINDPDDLAEEQRINAELERCAAAIGQRFTNTTETIRRASTSTRTLTSGKNGWIYCTSVAPSDEEASRRWRASMPDGYDHVDDIHRPREFARALGLVVAEQLGPRCREQVVKNLIDGCKPSNTRFKSQLIVHGPVVYASDPFELASGARSSIERMLLPIFVKDIRYADQLEYRFAIWAEDEPAETYVDLKVSKAMLGAFESRAIPPPKFTQPTLTETIAETVLPEPDESALPNPNSSMETDTRPPWNEGGLPDLADQSSTRVFPTSDPDRLVVAVSAAAAAEAALAAMRQVVNSVQGERRTRAASAAWHAEPFIRSLCSSFIDPVDSIWMTDDDILAIALKVPPRCEANAQIAFGPLGVHTYRVVEKGGIVFSYSKSQYSFADVILTLGPSDALLKKLTQLGLETRHQPR